MAVSSSVKKAVDVLCFCFRLNPNVNPNAFSRLQQELMGIMMSADPGASAFPNDDNLFEWTATLKGCDDTAVSDTCGVFKTTRLANKSSRSGVFISRSTL